jgi:hypothetical protein
MRNKLLGLAALSIMTAASTVAPMQTTNRNSSPEPKKVVSNKPSKKRNKTKSARKQKHRK